MVTVAEGMTLHGGMGGVGEWGFGYRAHTKKEGTDQGGGHRPRRKAQTKEDADALRGGEELSMLCYEVRPLRGPIYVASFLANKRPEERTSILRGLEDVYFRCWEHVFRGLCERLFGFGLSLLRERFCPDDDVCDGGESLGANGCEGKFAHDIDGHGWGDDEKDCIGNLGQVQKHADVAGRANDERHALFQCPADER